MASHSGFDWYYGRASAPPDRPSLRAIVHCVGCNLALAGIRDDGRLVIRRDRTEIVCQSASVQCHRCQRANRLEHLEPAPA